MIHCGVRRRLVADGATTDSKRYEIPCGPTCGMSSLYADPRANFGGGRRPHSAHPRPPPDLPSVSSSSSWAFPQSHPNIYYAEPSQREYEEHGGPSLRGTVERQNQKSHSQYLAATRPEVGDGDGIIEGLHMRHVLKSPSDERPHNPVFGEYKHGISATQPPDNFHRASTSNVEYAIEGHFQSKNCVLQAADDVGYLFGCGTKPQDEFVYVYNGEQSQGDIVHSPTAQAKERNLRYQMHVQQQQRQEDVNDVLFQVEKEYQTMQAVQDSNIAHQDFLHPSFPGTKHFPSHKPRAQDFVAANDDEYASSASCSIVSLMDYVMPNRRLKKENLKSRSGFFEAYHADNGGGYASNKGMRKRRSRRDILVTKVSDESSNGSMTRTRKHVRTASDSAVELQRQLKALVKERANQQSHTSPNYSKFIDIEETNSSSSDERRKMEQESIEKAREMLQKEVAQAQINIVAQQMNQFAAQSQLGMASAAATLGVSPTGATSPFAFVAPMTAPQIGGSVAGSNVPQMTPMRSQQHLTPTYQAPVFQQSPVFTQNSAQPTILSPQRPASQYDNNIRSPITTPSTAQLRHQQQPPSSRFPSSEAVPSSTSRSFEFEKSHALLSDLKVKNSLIRQDISRMKGCMSNVSGMTGPTVTTRGYGGLSIEPGCSKPPAKSPTWNHSRPAHDSNNDNGGNRSRPSPMSPQYTKQESTWRYDEARSERDSQGSVNSGRRGGGFSKRQPPSPIWTDYQESYTC